MPTILRARRCALPPLARKLFLTLLVCLGVVTPASRAQTPEAHPAPPAAPLTLEECIRIGLEQQPALNAARASLAAAEDQRQALDNLRLAALISRELPVRKQQAALGVSIAAAGVQQAEWETIYAVTRNYFSVIYAMKQERVVRDVLAKLGANREAAGKLLIAAKEDPDIKVDKIDVDKLDVYLTQYRIKLRETQKGAELARAALREAMGVPGDCPLPLVLTDLPGLGEALAKCQLVQLALTRRGELVQASNAAQVTDLEVTAQGKSFSPTFRTFAAVSDIHSRQIPQGVSNREYRPGAIGLDMPTTLAGRRGDRMQRARDFSARASAVVDKTTNLITLETEAAYLKWQDAVDSVRNLEKSVARARAIADAVDARANLRKSFGEEVIRARTLQESVQSQYNEALYVHALALAALERVTAGGFVPAFRSPTLRQQP
jgi:outer membrane protein TolC